ncbi:photo-regulated tyrosinase [Dentipellis sp. KUC8613]|nr:photo-regulated tyrosinase [Dentipellis sp. KUC8613]
MSKSRVVITGAVGGNTAGALAPNRIEINNFVKIEDQFSLYIRALQAMYNVDESHPTSFFQVGGIHGLPYISWDGSGAHAQSTQWEGYCTHASVLFPTWHRPYMALFEQVLQNHAKEIATKYTVDHARWTKAAADLRQPYWDWASNIIPPPEVISLTQVTIVGFDGKHVKVDNPLLRYKFHTPAEPSFTPKWQKWRTTLRHPTSDDADAKDNVEEMKRDLAAEQSPITTNTYHLMWKVKTWPAFSNTTTGDSGSSSNSLEAIHNSIHNLVGGMGHMGWPEVAGFDPIFYLHHANVDRMLSLWAALNPDIWVTAGSAVKGTWTIPPTATIDSATSLAPFWNSATTDSQWTSNKVNSDRTLGYTYPEFNGLDMGNKQAVRLAIGRIVHQLYGGGSIGTFASLAPGPRLDAPISRLESTRGVSATEADASLSQAEATIWDWTARVHVEQYAVGGSFSVLLFLGDVPSDPAQWHTSANFVGAQHAFVNGVPERCENCRGQGDLVVEGFVHLDEGIAKLYSGGPASLEPDVIKPYLSNELHWRVQKIDGTPVPLENVPSLEVVVIATPLSLDPGEIFPVPGDEVHHHDITRGRQGGSHLD